jgi:hypothetical protein
MTHQQFAAALREVAEFYETHPEAKLPWAWFSLSCDKREEFIRQANILADGGMVKKEADSPDRSYGKYKVTRTFGVAPKGFGDSVQVVVSIDREKVCKLVKPDVYECPEALAAEFEKL